MWLSRSLRCFLYSSSVYSCHLFLISSTSAAAKSLQSCPTLCSPIDGSPPGSPVPGILQARTLEWVAISFSNAWKWKVKVKSFSRVRLCVTPWTAAYQAQLLLCPYYFCPLLCLSLHEMFLWYLQFSLRDLLSFLFFAFLCFLCNVQLKRLSYLSLLFSKTLHSVGYVFSSSCFLFLFLSQLLFFSQLKQPICLLPFNFLWVGFRHCLCIMWWSSAN